MSIIIKGMEMPKRCEDCMCYRREISHAYCTISSVNVLGHGNARLDNCPLVELPPHGDLIDRAALMEEHAKAESAKYGNLFVAGDNRFIHRFLDAPVIVPSEKGETQ